MIISEVGAKTGPATEPPPPASAETKAAILKAATSDAIGQHIPGQDAEQAAPAPKVKTEKELEKERKKAEKNKKFLEKKAKAPQAAVGAGPSKTAEKKAKAAKATDDIKVPDYVEATPVGQKKILRPLDDPNFKAYDPIAVESAWNAWWEKERYFEPKFTKDGKVKSKGSFVISIPPPNVTGALHIGHALTDALQDTMIRW